MSETLLVYWYSLHPRSWRILVGGDDQASGFGPHEPPCVGLWVWGYDIYQDTHRWQALTSDELNRFLDGFDPFTPVDTVTREACELEADDVFTHVGAWAWYQVVDASDQLPGNPDKISLSVIRRRTGTRLDHAMLPTLQVEVIR